MKWMYMAVDYDIIIIGGGLVGASLACALGEQDLRIAVIEAVPLTSASQPSYNDRTVALGYGSRQIFEGIGIWSEIADLGATAIKKIHVSDRGHIGKTRLDCASEGLDALGYVVETRLLGQALGEQLERLSNVELICPAKLISLDLDEDLAQVEIDHDGVMRSLSTRLVVGADGVRSSVREQLGIKTFDMNYNQTAVITNVSVERPHQNVAYERFTASGPLALLPMNDVDGQARCSVVWTIKDKERDAALELDDAAFLSELQQRFGRQLGQFTNVGKRVAFPLALQQAREHVRDRLALIGNAAHTVHPIAGQGFNLGLRDVAVLAQVIVDASDAGEDIGELLVLKRYAKWRRRDHVRVLGFTDSMVRLFSNNIAPVALARNLSLVVTDIFPPLKKLITRQAMGLSGRLPKLARGLKLR
jgi:2-octaprenyl-6-methoxyphenol hydroxylase